jgi:CRP-like cAMP-binding protein
VCRRSRLVSAGQSIINEGQVPSDVHLVLEGLACRYKLMPNGERSIVGFLIPGDFCDLHVAILGRMDHGIAAIADSRIVEIPYETIADLTDNHPRINRALWWATLVDEATLRAWLANSGHRQANRQMAHLFCELLARMKAVGLEVDGSFRLPITQDDLGDALGISTVHVNRILKALRGKGLIIFDGKSLTVPDMDRLEAYAGFDVSYLHLHDCKKAPLLKFAT